MKSPFCVMIALFVCSCSSKQASDPTDIPTLPVADVKASSITTTQDYPASIEGMVNVEIRPQVNGILDKVFVDEGSFVNAGQPIFKIDDRPYQAALNNAEACLSSAEAANINAQLEVEKLTPLVQNKVVSDYQLKSAQAAQLIAKANIAQAKANVATAQINLGYTLIKAPVSGYIGRLLRKQGSLIAPTDAQALTELSDTRDVHVYFALGEKDFIAFKEQYPGATLKDKLKALPPAKLILADESEYGQKGKVDMVDGQFDNNTGAITLRVSFANSNGLLRSGNTGKIRLSLVHGDVLVVPQASTVEMQDKVFVFLVTTENKIKKQPLTIIGKSGESYLVKDGLKAGDRIVLSGFDNLQEGTAIHPDVKSGPLAAN
jgi:membrane fusion protein (multidrug efflux system)